MGVVCKDLGLYGEALKLLSESLDARRMAKDRWGETITLLNLGVVHMHLGRYQDALGCFTESLSIRREHTQDLWGEGLTLINMGCALARLGDFDDAEKAFQEGLEIQEEQQREHSDLSRHVIGQLYLSAGKVDLADPYIRLAGNPSSLGRLCLAKSEFQEAKEWYEKLHKASVGTDHADCLFAARTGLGIAHEELGEYQQASENYREAVELVEDRRSRLSSQTREKFLDVRLEGFNRTAPYEGLARVLFEMGRAEEAFKYSELSKARGFVEALAAAPSFDIGVDECEEPLSGQLACRTTHPQLMDLDKSGLRDHEWLLAYDATEKGILIFLVHGKRVVKAVSRPLSREELNDLISRYLSLFDQDDEDKLLTRLGNFDFETGKKLADILLGDLVQDLPAAAPVIVVPDDRLGMLPFETLVLNEGGTIEPDGGIWPRVSGAEFFGDRNPISYWQSVTAMTLAREFRSKTFSSGKQLIFAAPEYDGTSKGTDHNRTSHVFPPLLPFFTELGSTLTRVFGDTSVVYNGSNATKETFINKIAPTLDQYDTVVFATHGYFGKGLPGVDEPVLVLGPDSTDPTGFLHMSEVMKLRLKADLVVLSACQSGVGIELSGEGIMCLGRAFQYCGARSVLMTLGPVRVELAVLMVESFFRHLKTGNNKLQALISARKSVRDAGFDHPLFWAPFVLVGEVD